MSALQKYLMKYRMPPTPPASSSRSRKFTKRGRDYSPTSWDKYFQQKTEVRLSNTDIFRVYISGESYEGVPTICLLHGGGFSALTWSLFTTNIMNMIRCSVVALDLRGHGGTHTSDDSDLCADTLATDVGKVINHLFPNNDVPILLVGHSMGGAVAVHVAHLQLVSKIIGVTVIDVVEGTAMEALASMQSVLRGRPSGFKSLEHAIEWCFRTGQIRTLESAKVSMPGQLMNAETGQEAIDDIDDEDKEYSVGKTDVGMQIDSIKEEGDTPNESEDVGVFKKPVAKQFQCPDKYVWRIDLSRTENFWSGWFSGLSAKFLNLPCPKMLLLAGTDRLDKELTVGQMQGKFQMQVLSHSGHTIQEDEPEHVAEIIATFLVRHKLAQTVRDFERSFPAC